MAQRAPTAGLTSKPLPPAVPSIETLLAERHEAIRAAQVFGPGRAVTPLATYLHSAEVLAEDGRRAVVHFGARAKIVRVELLGEAPTATRLHLMAEAATEALLGASDEATGMLAELALAAKAVDSRPDHVVRDEALRVLDQPRGWRRAFAQCHEAIRTTLGEEATRLQQLAPRPRFGSVRAGLTEAAEVAVRTAMVEALAALGRRVSRVTQQTEHALRGVERVRLRQAGGSQVPVLDSVAADFVSHLRTVSETMARVPRSVRRVDYLGEVYDALAARVHEYEVMGRFIERAAESAST